MTQALWCVFIAGLLPYIATVTAKAGDRSFDNSNPRNWLARQDPTGYRFRANSAQLNAFEAFPFFAAAVIIAHIVHGPQARVDLIATLFVAARVLHLIFYLSNLAALRSLAWVAGLACVVAIFITAA